jgi:glycosyltransferase involved in cell wall biosynthesis
VKHASLAKMPTLLSINNYYYYRGGAETVFLEHNGMLEEHGWRVVPFSMQHPRNLDTPWSSHFVDEIEFGSDYSLGEKLLRVPKVIYSFEARRKLAALIDLTDPDVAHGHNIYHHISPSILGLLKQRGIPTVMTLHDLKIACPAYSMLTHDGICERCKGGRLYNVVANRCIKGSLAMSAIAMTEAVLHGMLGSYERCVSRFIVPSRFYLEKLVEWGKPRELFRHVPNFVDVARHRPDYSPGSSFLYVGRLSPEKGLATLVRAAAQSGSELALVGMGPQMEALRRLATTLDAKVTFHGYLRGDALQDAIRSARAVVLPSEWYENAPLSILEAYALGKPIIGARIGGIPELIREGETGLAFASGDVAALAAAMRALTRMPDAAVEELGRTARRWIETGFTAELYRERVLDIYRELGA